ncbi:hypothetical protein DDB_G0283791 [Dictyostelium discoideum AX4]|uniref:Uncharacterized protein n=1 Tax=Dictyostelium discoideum TaxID=44689 RepID=Q54QK6_DICDI|nr:hypothetical protein DDB_G0283791 [Dictyostelium discoideum AX4]EAL65510.1 hypothetical protein DDB_G0283791 [Dictyostelium discoideum AX4]|eukprot:XP_638865.1 hypothetical protein DDB_G0283791 [Dictyostelium discoideum AX4]
MISSTFNNNATPDFLINNNNFIFFNNNANIPIPLTNRLPYTNKFFNNNQNKKDEILINNNINNNNNNNIINNVEYDVPTLSPQIASVELLSLPQKQIVSSPSSSSVESSSVPQFPQYCSLKKCELCERGQPALLLKTPTWSSIMRVVFFTLHNEYPEKQYFSLKTEVYEFMTSHWERLCINRKRTDNWRKQIQDMLSHSKNVFESGLEKLKQNGFWKLRNIVDPWVINENKISSSSAESSPIINSNQWKKKRSFEDESNNNNNNNNNNFSDNNNNKKLKTPLFTPISSPSLSSSSSTTTTTNDQSTPELESIDNIFGKEIQSIRNETKKLFKLLPSLKNDQSLTKEILVSIQLKLSQYENRLNILEKEKESFRITLPFSPFPVSNKLSFNINNYSEPSSPSQQIPSSPSQSTDVSRSNSPIPAQTPKNNCNNNQKLFFA